MSSSPPPVTAGDHSTIHYGTQTVGGFKNVAVAPGGTITGSFNRKLSFRIGTMNFNVGLVPLAVAAVVLFGGGTAAVVAAQDAAPSAVVTQAVGSWRLAGRQSAGVGAVTAGSLTISPKAVYQVDMTISLDPAASLGSTAKTGLKLPALKAESSGSCGGEVTSREQVLVFTPFGDSSDSCRTFTGTVQGDVLTLGSGGASVRFKRA